MAPARKTVNGNKQSLAVNNVAVKKDEEDVETKQTDRRPGDILGSQWSETELQQFYEAYRKYGMDWKKVAAAVHSRSVEMVAALYSTNRAYLSLPEGTASVAGFIAMENSCSEQEGKDGENQEAPQRAEKRRRLKYRNSSFRDDDCKLSGRSLSQFVGSNSDCLSLLKANLPEGEARVVGKRTPRVPVAYYNEKDFLGENLLGKLDQKFKMNSDDHIAHDIALAIAKASHEDNNMHFTQEMTSNELNGYIRDEQDQEECMETIATYVGDIRKGGTVRNKERVGTVDIQMGWERYYGKNATTETRDLCLADMTEARSGTEEHNSSIIYNNLVFENPKIFLSKTPKRQMKNTLLDEDKSDAFEALNTLAELALLPETYTDNGSRCADINTYNGKWKGENYHGGDDDANNKCNIFVKGRNVSNIADLDDKSGSPKKKSPPCWNTEEMNYSLFSDCHKEDEHTHKSIQVVSCEGAGDFHSKTKNKRKRDLPMSLNHKFTNSDAQVESGKYGDGILNLKAKLANCLSWRKTQRWCTFEWFYSAIDYPWFARREFVEYLDYVGLGHIPRLTRVEWGVIRSSLGKPRRFSKQFLKEEKDKLNQYRESVRSHYTEIRLGTREGLPTDLARPLSVGRRIIAIHPKTRETHDGSVLTVDRNRCRVQFDQPELGVEFVMDTDCMPLHPLENMPASLAINKSSKNHHGVKLNRFASHNSSLQFTPDSHIGNSDGSLQKTAERKPIKNDIEIHAQLSIRSSEPTHVQQVATDQPVLAQAHKPDVKTLYDMTCAVAKKEAIVSELKRMNDEVEENIRKDSSFEATEHFSKRYASVPEQLEEVNVQSASALHCLRQRNAFQESIGLMTLKPALGAIGSLTRTDKNSISGFSIEENHVIEITDGSRSKAQKMVNVAMEAMSSVRNSTNGGVDGAIDFLNSRLSQEELCFSAAKLFPVSSKPNNQTGCASNVADKYNNISPVSSTQIPSELITNCVATLFMIQRCTERQLPPAEVAKVLDSAVTGLHPCSSHNLQLYSEIQKCMGIIRSQILALIQA